MASRAAAAASLSRQPLRERHNIPAAPPKKRLPLHAKESSLFLLPGPNDPVPDAPIDYTELWKAVSMANTNKSVGSSQGTSVYDDVLYRLGIDIEEMVTALHSPEEINVDGLPLQPTVQYSHLSTCDQICKLAEEHKDYYALNEPTLAAQSVGQKYRCG
jgi:hypothetical protein